MKKKLLLPWATIGFGFLNVVGNIAEVILTGDVTIHVDFLLGGLMLCSLWDRMRWTEQRLKLLENANADEK